MKIVNIKGNTFCIDTGMTYIPFYKINDEEIILLDSGLAKEREALDRLFSENGYQVAGILCSHAHIDHIGNNSYFKKKFNCVIAMSEFEAMICSSLVNLKVYYSSQALSQVEKNFGHMVCETDILISNTQDKIYVAGVKFKILQTPGHSPSHISIITPDDVAYLGDVLVSKDIMRGAKLPYEYILREDFKSKKKLLELNCRKYIVAHKGVYDDIRELVAENIRLHQTKADRVLALVDRDMSKEEIMNAAIEKFHILIKRTSKYLIVEQMLTSYVEYLLDTKQLTLKMKDGVLKYSPSSEQS